MVPVFRCSDYVEAHLVKGLLEHHGIGAFVQGAMLQGALGDLPATGHLILLVEAEDQEAAKRLIAAYDRGELGIGEDEPAI